MCKGWNIRYACTHITQVRLSTCRGTISTYYESSGKVKVDCSGSPYLTLRARGLCGQCLFEPVEKRNTEELESLHLRRKDFSNMDEDTQALLRAEVKHELFEAEKQFGRKRFTTCRKPMKGLRTSQLRRGSLLSREVKAEDVVDDEDFSGDGSGWGGDWNWSGSYPSLDDEVAENEIRRLEDMGETTNPSLDDFEVEFIEHIEDISDQAEEEAISSSASDSNPDTIASWTLPEPLHPEPSTSTSALTTESRTNPNSKPLTSKTNQSGPVSANAYDDGSVSQPDPLSSPPYQPSLTTPSSTATTGHQRPVTDDDDADKEVQQAAALPEALRRRENARIVPEVLPANVLSENLHPDPMLAGQRQSEGGRGGKGKKGVRFLVRKDSATNEFEAVVDTMDRRSEWVVVK